MNRTQKAEMVEGFTARLAESPFVVGTDYRGVSSNEVNDFRRALEGAGVEYHVVKNKLAMRAIAGTDMEDLGGMLAGMTAWVGSGDDPISAAKVLRESSRALVKADKFNVKGGFFDGDVLDAAAISKVADLPSKEELLVLLLRTIQEGPRQVLGVIQGPGRDLVNLLKNYENKLDEAQ